MSREGIGERGSSLGAAVLAEGGHAGPFALCWTLATLFALGGFVGRRSACWSVCALLDVGSSVRRRAVYPYSGGAVCAGGLLGSEGGYCVFEGGDFGSCVGLFFTFGVDYGLWSPVNKALVRQLFLY